MFTSDKVKNARFLPIKDQYVKNLKQNSIKFFSKMNNKLPDIKSYFTSVLNHINDQNIKIYTLKGEFIFSKICDKYHNQKVINSGYRERLTLIFNKDICIGGFTNLEYQIVLEGNKEAFLIVLDKVDTSGYETVKGVIANCIGAYISWVKDFYKDFDLSFYCFAKPSQVYLFRRSDLNSNKRILDDIKLIKWWKEILEWDFLKTESDIKPNKYWYIPGTELNEIGKSLETIAKDWEYSTPYHKYYSSFNDITAGEIIYQLNDDAKSRLVSKKETTGMKWDDFFKILAYTEEFNVGKRAALLFVEIKGNKIKGMAEQCVLESLDSESEGSEIQSDATDSGNEEEKDIADEDCKSSENEEYKEEESLYSSENEDCEDISSNNHSNEENDLDIILRLILEELDYSSLESAKESSKRLINKFKELEHDPIVLNQTVNLKLKLKSHHKQAIKRKDEESENGKINSLGGLLIKKKK